MLTTRCTICGKEFTEEECMFEMACPSCGTKSMPCDISDDVIIKINWHELHILTVWAENWARKIDEESKDTDEFNHLHTVMVIAERLQRQYPDKIPITLFGELRILKSESSKKNIGIVSDLDDESKLGF